MHCLAVYGLWLPLWPSSVYDLSKQLAINSRNFPFLPIARETDSGCSKAKGSSLKEISIRKQSKGSHAVKGFHGENCGFTQRGALLSRLLISLCSTCRLWSARSRFVGFHQCVLQVSALAHQWFCLWRLQDDYWVTWSSAFCVFPLWVKKKILWVFKQTV